MKLYMWTYRSDNRSTDYSLAFSKREATRERAIETAYGWRSGPIVTVDLPEPKTMKRKARK